MAVGLVGAAQAPRRKVSLPGALQSWERRGLRESAVQSFEGQSLASFKAEPRNAISRPLGERHKGTVNRGFWQRRTPTLAPMFVLRGALLQSLTGADLAQGRHLIPRIRGQLACSEPKLGRLFKHGIPAASMTMCGAFQYLPVAEVPKIF